MVKKTKTMAATVKDAKVFLKKQKKPRTSTIDQTLAVADAGFKQKKKATKTKTMAQTLKDAAKKTKKVAKKPKQTKKAKVAKKAKSGKKAKK